MSSNSIALLVVVAYMVALISFSFYARRMQAKRAKTGESGDSFLLANRSFGMVLVMVTIIGVALGANGTVGISQNGYAFGISAGWYDGAFAVGIVATAFLFVKKLRSLNLKTISQIYGDYYGEKTRFISSVGQLFMNFCIMIAQFIAGGAILSSLLPQYFTLSNGMLISGAIFLAIASIGGMMSTGITNVVNIVLLYISVILAVIFTLSSVGGWDVLVQSLPEPETFLHPVDGLGVGVFISYLILFFVHVPTSQSTVQMIFAAKDEKSAFWGYLIGGLMVLPFGFATAMIGMAARVMFPTLENTAMALPSVIMTFPGVVAGIVLAGMWAADVSTATSLILGNSALFINDIYKPMRKSDTPFDEVRFSKIVGVVFTVLTLFCAFFIKFLLKFITMGLSLCVAYFIILIASLYFPKLCKNSSAILTLLASFIVVALWMIVPAFSGMFSHVIYPQLIVCFTVFFLTAFFDKKPAAFRMKGTDVKTTGQVLESNS
ncbi:sodium:solute symporter family protein [Fusibacter paucivorans]|uniref:Sodium:solute symporter family protein n=1 Tax=Fusibacter paucivorans TaxID=76009 RepID=A0ABS5PNI3_9FIRM|nr:sodium:solute symporter family protein [Fusibacter paucivorans]MBS7526735.1 sodium:solute symporter family protein [Fusibacter paucivorans]